MRELFLYPLSGLYDECHRVDYRALATATKPDPTGPYCLRQLNNLWWHNALSRESLDGIIDRLERRYAHSPIEIRQHEVVLTDPEKFIAEAQRGPLLLADLGAGPRVAFRALETLSIFTDLYSDLVSSPFVLSLQEGLVTNELSSLQLSRDALSPTGNPYLQFLEEFAFPVIEAADADLLWIVGPIKISTFAMAMYAKRMKPTCHVSVVGHSSEYYSLNKIAKYLRTNELLFETIDSIILDDFENTPPQLRQSIAFNHPLSTVPNLMYADREAGSIEQTGYQVADQTFDFYVHTHDDCDAYSTMDASPSHVVEVRLFQNSKCYWNACNFCGINKRYRTLPRNDFSGAATVVDAFEEFAASGKRYLWSGDEAIPPADLERLAEELIDRGSTIEWETRSKIDKGFTHEVCRKLGRAGLREIRLGLESASPRVLNAMGKFPDGWSTDLIEEIVADFHDAGVSVHFPTIIGFPSETADEREETFLFLEYLLAKYPSVTYNSNILGFDIASRLFDHYEEFGITTVRWPAPAKYFLGNLLDFDCEEAPFDFETLDAERNERMRSALYPWMPATTSIPVYIFYRLTETSRATVVWKAQRAASGNWRNELPQMTKDFVLRLSPGAVISGPHVRSRYDASPRYRAYDWWSHNYVELDLDGFNVAKAFVEPLDVGEFVDGLPLARREQFLADITSLYELGLLIDQAASQNELGWDDEATLRPPLRSVAAGVPPRSHEGQQLINLVSKSSRTSEGVA